MERISYVELEDVLWAYATWLFNNYNSVCPLEKHVFGEDESSPTAETRDWWLLSAVGVYSWSRQGGCWKGGLLNRLGQGEHFWTAAGKG